MLRGSVFSGASADSGLIEIGELTPVGVAADASVNNSDHWLSLPTLARILVIVYIVGVALMTVVSLFGLLQLLKVIGKGEKIPMGKFTLVITDNKRLAPFSWMRYVVMNAADYAESGDVIMEHERCHLRLRHWVDLIMAQMVICLQWFNPAAWLMRDELRNVHEYQADEAVMKSGADIAGYQKMLIKKAVGSRFQSFANSLNHSKLKKRVTMMYKEKSSAACRMSALLLAPALAAGCFATAIPAVARVLDSFEEVTFATDSENKVSKISETSEIKIAHAPSVTLSDASKEDAVSIEVKSEEDSFTSSEVAEDIADPQEIVATAEIPAHPSKEREIFKASEKIAEFPGGMAAMMSYLQDNIKYPEEAIKNDEQGMVVVKFVVEADGSITEVETVKSVTPSLDAEAMRVVKSMPKWNPGKVKDEPVAVWFTLPVSFKLPADSGISNK